MDLNVCPVTRLRDYEQVPTVSYVATQSIIYQDISVTDLATDQPLQCHGSRLKCTHFGPPTIMRSGRRRAVREAPTRLLALA